MRIFSHNGKKGRVYWVEFRYHGKRHRISLKTTNLQIAKKRSDAYQDQIFNDTLHIDDSETPAKIVTLSEFFDEHFERAEAEKKPSTIKNEKMYAREFTELLQDCSLTDLNYRVLEEWRARMLSRKLFKGKEKKEVTLSPTTFNIRFRFLRGALNHAVKRGYIKHNILRDFKEARTESKRRYMYDEEVEKILQLIDADIDRSVIPQHRNFLILFRCYVVFLLHTGMRRSEALFLRQQDIRTFDNVEIVEIVKSKTGRNRVVALNDEAKQCLRDAGEGLFSSLDARHVTRKFHDYAVRAGLGEGITLHSLRHTFATRLRRENVALETIQDMTGHTNLSTTLRYAKPTIDSMKAAVNKLQWRKPKENE